MSPTVKTVIVTLGWLGCGSGGKTLSQKCKKKKKNHVRVGVWPRLTRSGSITPDRDIFTSIVCPSRPPERQL